MFDLKIGDYVYDVCVEDDGSVRIPMRELSDLDGDWVDFDYICQGVTEGIARINAQGDIPVIFGLLTVLTHEQAEERAGGRLGNKGKEFALTAIKMVDYAWKLQK